MPDIPLPKSSSDNTDIYSYGFDKSLNRVSEENKTTTESNAVIYDANSQINSNQIVGGVIPGYVNLTSENTAIGQEALANNVNRGTANVAIGYKALNLNISGYDNIAIGNFSLQNNTTGNQNLSIGNYSLQNNVDGYYNVALGKGVLRNNISGVSNVAIGYSSLNNNTSNYNTAIGYYTLLNNISGNNNIAIGYLSQWKNISGIQNVSIGGMLNKIEGNNNVSIGVGSLSQGTSNSGCVCVGINSGYDETGSNKLYIANSSATAGAALIYGDFGSAVVCINGTLQVLNGATGTFESAGGQILTVSSGIITNII